MAKKSNYKKAKTQQVVMRVHVRNFLIGVTLTLAVLAILLGGSGGLEAVIVGIALPFVGVGLFVLWGTYAMAQSLLRSISSENSVKVPSFNSYLAKSSIVLLLIGAFLLVWFITQGGPQNGSGGSVVYPMAFHILGNNSNPYLEMQVGLVLLILGTSLGLLNHFLISRMRIKK